MTDQANVERLVSTANTLALAMVASSNHLGRSFDLPKIEAAIRAGLPAEFDLSGRQVRVSGQTMQVVANGAVVATKELTAAQADDLLVQYAISRA